MQIFPNIGVQPNEDFKFKVVKETPTYLHIPPINSINKFTKKIAKVKILLYFYKASLLPSYETLLYTSIILCTL